MVLLKLFGEKLQLLFFWQTPYETVSLQLLCNTGRADVNTNALLSGFCFDRLSMLGNNMFCEG